jgi:hypothetical protein
MAAGGPLEERIESEGGRAWGTNVRFRGGAEVKRLELYFRFRPFSDISDGLSP